MSRPIVYAGWPLEAFIGDVVVCTLQGENLGQVTGIEVAPAAKGITATIGDPLGKGKTPPQHTDTELTVTFEISLKTYAGDKRIQLLSPEGSSNPLPFLIMM